MTSLFRINNFQLIEQLSIRFRILILQISEYQKSASKWHFRNVVDAIRWGEFAKEEKWLLNNPKMIDVLTLLVTYEGEGYFIL